MKTLELRKILIEEQYLRKWIKKDTTYESPAWEWNEDDSIDVNGSVWIREYVGDILPVKFNIINGNFNCSYNQLKTFENFPRIVKGDFGFSDNLLTSLEHFPETVLGTSMWTYNYPVNFSSAEIRKISNFKGQIIDRR